MIILISIFLTPYFYYVPDSSLAAIILIGATGLIDTNIIKYLYNIEPEMKRKRGFLIHSSALLGTLLVGVTWGILVPVGISTILLVKDATKLKVVELGMLRKTKIWRPMGLGILRI